MSRRLGWRSAVRVGNSRSSKMLEWLLFMWALFVDFDEQLPEFGAVFSRDLDDRQVRLVTQTSLRNGRTLDIPERLMEVVI